MVSKISSVLKAVPNITPQDITTQRTGAYVDMSGAQRALVVATTGTVTAASTVTLQLMQAQDTAGTGAKVLGSPIVLTAPVGNGPLAPSADVQITDLDTANGFKCIAARLVSNSGSAVQGAAVLLFGGNRYAP